MYVGQASAEEAFALLSHASGGAYPGACSGTEFTGDGPRLGPTGAPNQKLSWRTGRCSLARGHRLLARNSTRTNPPDAIWKGRGRRSCRYTSSSTAPPGTPFTCTTRPASGSCWTCRVTATTRARYDLTEPRPVEPRRRGAPVPGRGAALPHAGLAGGCHGVWIRLVITLTSHQSASQCWESILNPPRLPRGMLLLAIGGSACSSRRT